jgi:hypothetical protein
MATSKERPTITPAELLLPVEEPSLLFTQRELIRTNGINFEQWWDEFKTGFVNGKRDKDTNYKTALWTKPKYVNITPTTSTSGAITIEYWPDKTQLKNSYLLSGTVASVIEGIVNIMREKALADNGTSGKGSKPLLRGYPCLKLFFKGDDNIEGVKQIRCVGFTEDAKIAAASKNIELLKEADINRWAGKIKSIFGETGYVWQKGISCLSYSGIIARLQGVEGYAYVKTEADGIALFAAMLKIFDQKPDRDGFNFSKKINPGQFGKANSTNIANSETKLVLGKPLPAERRRPVGNCKFVGAALYLDSIKKPIHIVRGGVVLSVNI